jgi:hypothetical protein
MGGIGGTGGSGLDTIGWPNIDWSGVLEAVLLAICNFRGTKLTFVWLIPACCGATCHSGALLGTVCVIHVRTSR